jgi:hypothetical protein
MPSRRLVRADDIVRDIRSGLTDAELMAKHRFSAIGLQSVFKQLLDLKAITRTEVYGRLPRHREEAMGEDIEVQSLRKSPRHLALFPIPIYDGKNPKISGMLRDITEHGVGVTGLETSVGETRTLVVLGDEFVAVEFETFVFDAVCRWVQIGKGVDSYVAGFEITSLTDRDREQLSKLIQSLTFCDSPE